MVCWLRQKDEDHDNEYRPDDIQQIFDNGDELTLPDILPGFAVPVKKFCE